MKRHTAGRRIAATGHCRAAYEFTCCMRVLKVLLIVASLACSACGTTGGALEEPEPVLAAEDPSLSQETPESPKETEGVEGEVPLVVAESERPETATSGNALEEVVVQAPRGRHELILDLVSVAQSLLRDVELEYFFTGKGKRQVLRGRPVAFALWSDAKQEWSIAHIEIPRPPIKWKPGKKPLPFIVRTPGITARHVKGTGAERLMFAFSKDGEPLKVYGRKFPVFDSALLAKKKWRAVVRDREAHRLSSIQRRHARSAVCQWREGVPSWHSANRRSRNCVSRRLPASPFRESSSRMSYPPAVITTLAVIEQTDDADFLEEAPLPSMTC